MQPAYAAEILSSLLVKLAGTNALDRTEKREIKMPQTRIESDKLFIKDVFQKWYRIPEYQRPYVWGADQVNELLDDVYRAQESNPDSQYFLGSMVLKKSNKQDGGTQYEEYDLLDGQQRLTTLFLITAVVRDLSPESNVTRINTCRNAEVLNPDIKLHIPSDKCLWQQIKAPVNDRTPTTQF